MLAHWTKGEIKFSRRGGRNPKAKKKTLCCKSTSCGHHAKVMVRDM
jgi:hypothetical protein